MKYYHLFKQNLTFISFIIAEIILIITTLIGFFSNLPINDYFLFNIIIILNVFIFYLYFTVCQYFKEKAIHQVKTDIIRQQLKLQKEYEIVRQENNKIYSQIKNQIIEHLDEHHQELSATMNEADIKELIHKSPLPLDTYHCTNKIVDAILYNKMLLCKYNGIKESTAIYLPEHININDVDLISLYTNLFDNAIEACQHVNEQEKVIIIQSRVIHNHLVINIKNSYNSAFIKSHFFTTKKDVIHHGFGMKIINMIIKKYDGTLRIKKNLSLIEFQISLNLYQPNKLKKNERI